MKNILDLAELNSIRLQQSDGNMNRKWLSKKGKQTERCHYDMHLQQWYRFLARWPKAIIDRLLKTQYKYETYFNTLSLKHRIMLTRFGLGTHRVPIEIGRLLNIPRKEIVCHICNQRRIRDEFHVNSECNTLN